MTGARVARVVMQNGGSFRVETPYSERWVERVKARVHHTRRDWNPDAKPAYWTFYHPEDLKHVMDASMHVGWIVRIEWPGGEIEIRYPDGTVEREKQEDLFA